MKDYIIEDTKIEVVKRYLRRYKQTNNMAEEQWERWDCDSSSWETHDDTIASHTAEEIHDESELQLPLVRVRNLSAILEEEKMNDFRHMFAASMFSSCTDLDTLSIYSDRTVRMCNRKEKDDEENSCNNEITISDDVEEKATQHKSKIEEDRNVPKNKHDNTENKDLIESQFQIKKRTRRVSCPGPLIRRDLILTEGGRARAA